jgi:hypothetical protein
MCMLVTSSRESIHDLRPVRLCLSTECCAALQSAYSLYSTCLILANSHSPSFFRERTPIATPRHPEAVKADHALANLGASPDAAQQSPLPPAKSAAMQEGFLTFRVRPKQACGWVKELLAKMCAQ